MDNALIRKDFPLLDDSTFYFNNASTLLKPNCVIQAINDLYTKQNSEFIGGYQNSDFVNAKIAECKSLVSQLINCAPEEVIFTSNCTEALDRLAQLVDIKEGDNVVCSKIDHNANFSPWLKRKANIFLLDILPDGSLDLEALEEILKNNTVKIVSAIAMSNTAGNKQNFKKITELGHKYGALVCIDFAQYLPHFPVDFRDTGCDFACFSGHKIGGSCVGVLVGKKDILENIRTREHSFGEEFYLEHNVPIKPCAECFDFGYLPILNIVAFCAALKYFITLGYEKITMLESELRDHFFQKAEETGTLKFLFPIQQGCAPFFTFKFAKKNVDLMRANELLATQHKIVLSCGVQCAQAAYKMIGESCGLRASLSFYNTKEEVDYLFEKLQAIAE